MKVQMHSVVKWDVTSKTLKTKDGEPFEMRILTAKGEDGAVLVVDLFIRDEDE